MSRSTENVERQGDSAAEILRELLQRIAVKNVENADKGRYVYHVSHAWTEGPTMFLVYTTPHLEPVWGLARDTRRSLIDPGPWADSDDPALYYYLIDFEEGWSGPLSRQPGDDPEFIHWRGDLHESLPKRVSDVPAPYRHKPPRISTVKTEHEAPPTIEPRQYGNPV